MLEAIERIERYAALGRRPFEDDELIQTWFVHHLQIIGEAAAKLGHDFHGAHPEISWAEIVAMRNILAHDYFGIDLKAHYYSGRRWFFTLGALLPVIDAVDTLLKGHAHWLTLGSIYPITLVTQFVLMIVASWTDSERFHGFFAVFFLLQLLAFIIVDLNILV